ncbi:23S rRNA (uracil(747)-C(5))-methyltransferase RlmC [Jonesia denitrificans]|uniref:23S rRNA (Uracil-5-)-methyltransferase RumB n=1 Tax=Jonesia denitrificans (strain ATCC 14870 / DSM 20603 / BCRC 15368 / CIP 55.134 / JCM 11481 / NBRC 15587 / NCTC 10816 / Prevot 55134) TaxID=471856 RepID=C7R2N2_JONDD|nr:23S rRNA (uracil(747)-C(5))-methyltransferase RlmC [Jonesia denitrificans]ACV10023.1 23S rRNA (uracil-5-)-methyltransferase RumB [Jonesia denitrificans DSM 20603]ASE08744.1 23S rRNA (uracil(747)-C(5))-methyltransferase RlmC [Jonesia denitrificans]QXB44431.1 23S rRNA (uracil(747)-C(5))-methyltransferase RlmC [Jonesia denitrificans]SQH22815.1 23S rRNA (uracil(747)-C(5))-methyltransferase RlmC [Jonesia denitrificans]
MQCHHFDAHRCRSCALLDIPYERQLATKAADVHALLGEYPDLDWLPPVASAQAGFRNKAKMAVSGTADNPILGILDASFGGVDLRDCPLYTQGMQEVLDAVRAFIMAARIEPYRVADRRGELKYVLVTESPDSEYMVRFVARSQEPVTRISKHLPGWLAENPQVRVVTVNLQPEHKAILEGDREIVLTKDNSLTMRVGDIPLYLRPQSFFQTNTPVAAHLYRQAEQWIADARPQHVWDLFCGVGGFALHAAPHANRVTGVEISAEAIESARTSAAERALTNVTFDALDATTFSTGHSARLADGGPDLVVVNPPRRGIGVDLAEWLNASDAHTVVYSSCNARSLAKDLTAMPQFQPTRARLFDMFPHTNHVETVVLMSKVATD